MIVEGREYRHEPVNITLAETTRLFRVDRPFVVVLEPGDATRYELVIMPTERLVTAIHETGRIEYGNLNYGPEYRALVTRCVGGKPYGTAVMVSPGMWPGELNALCANGWTQTVLDAWFQEFWKALG